MGKLSPGTLYEVESDFRIFQWNPLYPRLLELDIGERFLVESRDPERLHLLVINHYGRQYYVDYSDIITSCARLS